MTSGNESTGAPDPLFDLVSVLYHALEGAATYAQYEQDARQRNDQELADFFRSAQVQSQQLADQAKSILSDRLASGGAAGFRNTGPS
jgi:hypothetical protein